MAEAERSHSSTGKWDEYIKVERWSREKREKQRPFNYRIVARR